MADDKHGPACPDCGGEMHEVTIGYATVDQETGETVQHATIREALVYILAKERAVGLKEEASQTEKMIAEYDKYHRRKIN